MGVAPLSPYITATDKTQQWYMMEDGLHPWVGEEVGGGGGYPHLHVTAIYKT